MACDSSLAQWNLAEIWRVIFHSPYLFMACAEASASDRSPQMMQPEHNKELLKKLFRF